MLGQIGRLVRDDDPARPQQLRHAREHAFRMRLMQEHEARVHGIDRVDLEALA